MENLDRTLKKLRDHLGLSQVAMAKRLGVPMVTYRYWELGCGQPNYENKLKIQEVLKELAIEKQAE